MNSASDQIALNELASRVGHTWANAVSCHQPVSAEPFSTWDEATLYTFGRLDGSLETYRAFNERVNDLDFEPQGFFALETADCVFLHFDISD